MQGASEMRSDGCMHHHAAPNTTQPRGTRDFLNGFACNHGPMIAKPLPPAADKVGQINKGRRNKEPTPSVPSRSCNRIGGVASRIDLANAYSAVSAVKVRKGMERKAGTERNKSRESVETWKVA